MQRARSNVTMTVSVALLGATALFSGCLRSSSNCQDDGVDCPATGGSGGTGANSAGTAGKGGGTGGGSGNAQGGSTSGDAGQPSGGSDVAGGGTTGGEGGTGGMVSLPCDGACAAPKPICDELNDTCVQCLKEQDCTTAAKKKCDTASKSCVECLGSTDCPSATAAKCDAGSCGKCTSNDDCAHIAGKTICDKNAGECVQCTVADETACGGKSCNPATRACTSTSVGTVDICRPCLADSECVGGNKADPATRCVGMTFADVPRPGGFCLRRVAKTCDRPYKVPLTAASLSGSAAEDYCGIDQATTRCEAVLDVIASRSCPGGLDTECGCKRDGDGNCTETGQGGLCRLVGTDVNTCTIPCGILNQCPEPLTCTGISPNHCK